MEFSRHPTYNEIQEYVRETLSDEKHMEIGEHLFACKECMNRTREEYKDTIVLENWSAHNAGELLWRMKILSELKNNKQYTGEWTGLPEEEKLAAESASEDQMIIKHYYSEDKRIIATVEYSAQTTEVSFETRDPEISDSLIIFAFVLLASKKVIMCDKVRLETLSPGIWEKRWQGAIPYAPDLSLLFTY
jgi:hypothetical protein